MRFEQINLVKYGRFDGCSLRFDSGGPDLHIVFGPNEAGKTTTLSAVRDLLFGFRHTTDHDYRFDRKLLRVGAAIEGEGTQLTFRRKKGLTRTLLDEHDMPIADELLTRHLAGYDASSFERMFSLDHTRLRQGGEAILQASDDVGQAIFAAGSGLTALVGLHGELDDAARAIWTRTQAKDRRYYIALRNHEEARIRLRDAQVRPAKWDSVRRALQNAEGELAGERKKHSETQAEIAKLQRHRRIKAPAARYRLLSQRLEDLGQLPAFPLGSSETFQKATAEISRCGTREKAIGDSLAAHEEELSALHIPESVLENMDQIGAARERKGVIDQLIAELPRRKATQQTHADRLSALQSDLGWSGLTIAGVREKVPSRARLNQLQELIQENALWEERLAAAKRTEQGAEQKLAIIKKRGLELSPPSETTRLAALVRSLRSKASLTSQLQDLQGRREDAQRSLTYAMDELKPWEGTIEALRHTTVPSDEAATAAADRLKTADADLIRTLDLQRQAREALKRAQLQVKQFEQGSDAVSIEAVQALRQSRDALWRAIRERAERASAPESATMERFEEELKDSDELADRRFLHAQDSAKLAVLHDACGQAQLQVELMQDAIDEATRAAATALANWEKLAEATGFKLAPEAFRAWTNSRGKVLEIGQNLDALSSACEKAQKEVYDATTSLQEALCEFGVEINGMPLDELTAAAEEFLSEQQEKARDRATAKEQIDETTKDLASLTADRESTEERYKTSSAALRDALQQAHLDPADHVSLIRSQIELMEETRNAADDFLSLEQRISAMHGEVEAFQENLRSLAEKSGLKTSDQASMEGSYAILCAAAQKAQQASEQGEVLSRLRDAASKELKTTRLKLQEEQAAIRPLHTLARTDSLDDLASLLSRADEARELRAELDELTSELLEEGEGAELKALLELGAQSNADELRAQSATLEACIPEMVARIEELAQSKRERQLEFDGLDDRPDAAVAAADLASAKAELANCVDDYVRVRAEATVLKWVMDRYRRERQAPLLSAASSIFQRLTLGAYIALEVDLESSPAQLVGLMRDGETVVPATRMSEGTADQLYLALRLAAVEQAVDAGARLPFIADDLFINFDDERASAGFGELARLAEKTQVLFFTHHDHLLEVASKALHPVQISRCDLPPREFGASSSSLEEAA
jgi:uncharacterized protein YhaN